ncbi:sulfotransferase domain-containing protein [Roseinatronobacter sp.]
MAPDNFLFIIGTAKAGTSALANWLGLRDDMVLGMIKEPRYHSDLNKQDWTGPSSSAFAQTILTDAQQYDRNFGHKPGATWAIDASTDYLWCPASPELLAQFARTRRCKVICLTRDPVERTISQYRHTLRMGVRETLERALDREDARIRKTWQPLFWHIRRSRVARDLQTYADLFGQDLMVMDHAELQEPDAALAKVAAFLGLPPSPLQGRVEHNTTYLPRNRLVAMAYQQERIRRVLRNLFPDKMRSSLRKLLLTSRPVQVSDTEKHLVLSLLKDEIAACTENPLLPTGNWHSAQLLDT